MAHGGDRRRRSQRLGVLRCGGQIDTNERTCKLAWVLRKLATCSGGGEHERGALAPAAATMAAAMARAARCCARGEAEGLYTRLGRPAGDARVTAEMPAVLRRLEARAYGGDAADGPPIRGARAYGGACLGAPRDGAI
jgi:hypothetical protein